MSSTNEPKVIALVRDLMFLSKITATARAVGIEVRTVRDPKMLPDAAGELLLVDLNLPEAITSAAAWSGASADRKVIGFVSHVDSATIASAREAGIDQVLARSAFTDRLEQILREGTSDTAPSK